MDMIYYDSLRTFMMCRVVGKDYNNLILIGGGDGKLFILFSISFFYLRVKIQN